MWSEEDWSAVFVPLERLSASLKSGAMVERGDDIAMLEDQAMKVG